MKQLLITIAALVLVGCGDSQPLAPTPELKPIKRVEGAKAQTSHFLMLLLKETSKPLKSTWLLARLCSTRIMLDGLPLYIKRQGLVTRKLSKY